VIIINIAKAEVMDHLFPSAPPGMKTCPTHHCSHPTKDAVLVSKMKNNQISNIKTAKEIKEAKDNSDRANMIH
jgi:hypothetical protein